MLTFLHISDTHISADPAFDPPGIPASLPHPKAAAERLLAAIERLPFEIEFILHTGDVCADPIEQDYHCARELLSRLSKPVYLLPGNHDSAQLMADILHDGEGLQVLGDAQVQLGSGQLLTLDTNGEGDEHAPMLRDEQIDWFAQSLESDGAGPVIVAVHHPLIETGVPWIDQQMRVQNGERIQQILRRHHEKVAGVFHGHIHQATVTASEGIVYISCPSTWSNLAGYPSLSEPEADLHTAAGFNLVMVRETRAFVRRYSLPLVAP
ncbi:MAG: metallophosphoesterase [Chloroflexi bacterium]|nr:metallophosphoesterase [Chloroflexota bacterium]